MGRKPKYPNHKEAAKRLKNRLLDDLINIWTEQEKPQLKNIAEELGMSHAKVRKLLITAGVGDKNIYYESDTANQVLHLWSEKKSVKEIAVLTGLSVSSVTGYTPHSKIVY